MFCRGNLRKYLPMEIIALIICQLLHFLYSLFKHLFCQFCYHVCFYFLQKITYLYRTLLLYFNFLMLGQRSCVSFHAHALLTKLKQLRKRNFCFLFLKDLTVVCKRSSNSRTNDIYCFKISVVEFD